MTRVGRLPIAFLSLSLTYLAVNVNVSVTSIALPSIGTDLGASTAQLSWIYKITPLVSIGVMLFAGAWIDRFGRRRVLVIGLTIFLVSAILSALTRDVTLLIALRAITGVGASLAMPAALALTFDVVPDASRRTAVGLLGATQAGGSLIGPVLAGGAMALWSWPAAFLTVVPFIAVALIGARRLPENVPGANTPMDSRGAGLTLVASVAAVYSATALSSRALLTALISLVIAIVAVVTLVNWERRVQHPLFDSAVLGQRRFRVAILVVFGAQVVLGGVLFVLTQYLQLALGYSPLIAGLLLTPALAGWVLASAVAGRAAAVFGARRAVTIGLALSSVGLAVLAFAASQRTVPSTGLLILGLIFTGLMAIGPALMTHTVVDCYPIERRAVGSATNGAAARFGFSMGIALLGAVLSLVYGWGLRASTQPLTAAQAETVKGGLAGALRVATTLPDGMMLTEVARSAFITGYQATTVLSSMIMAALTIVVAFSSQGADNARQGTPEPN
jgi:DHA2 family multidrug resistance protein-like MFS transporter